MIIASEIKLLELSKKKALILSEAEPIIAPDNLGKLEKHFKIARVFDQFIAEYIDFAIAEDNAKAEGSVLQSNTLRTALKTKLDYYLSDALEKVVADPRAVEDMMQNPKNAYELAGARELAFANKITRNLSTTMGNLWEKLADISPYAVNPEIEFGIKVKGIDILCKNIGSKELESIQLKTTKNTLTGSQSGRTNSELRLHRNPKFAAAFDVARGWTFQNDPNVEKIAGAQFWSRIGMDYEIVYDEVVLAIKQLEAKFVAAVAV